MIYYSDKKKTYVSVQTEQKVKEMVASLQEVFNDTFAIDKQWTLVESENDSIDVTLNLKVMKRSQKELPDYSYFISRHVGNDAFARLAAVANVVTTTTNQFPHEFQFLVSFNIDRKYLLKVIEVWRSLHPCTFKDIKEDLKAFLTNISAKA